jgi:hypothetical protein
MARQLTAKGAKILTAMQGHYGAQKGRQVFYASANAGTITNVFRAGALFRSRHWEHAQWEPSAVLEPSRAGAVTWSPELRLIECQRALQRCRQSSMAGSRYFPRRTITGLSRVRSGALLSSELRCGALGKMSKVRAGAVVLSGRPLRQMPPLRPRMRCCPCPPSQRY